MPATRSPFRLALILTLTLGHAAACGGDDPSNPDDGGDPPGEEIPMAQRVAAFDDVRAELAQLAADNPDPAAMNAAIAAYLETRPEFSEVGVDEESSTVYAVFTDGRGLIIPNNLFLGTSPDGSTQLRRPASGVRLSSAHADASLPATVQSIDADAGSRTPDVGAAAANPAELPTSRKARLLHTFSAGTAFEQGSIDVIGEMALMLSQAGWDVSSGGTAASTVEALRAVSGDGFFYINTHGGPGRTWYGVRVENVYAIQTSSIVTPFTETDDITEGDLETGRLVYIIANSDGSAESGFWDTDVRYAITPKFVEHYMSFSANALVFLNACESGKPHPVPEALAAAFRAKGASVVLGWENAVNAYDAWYAAKFLVDRMTGANRFEPEASKHRPFPLEPVLAYMHDRGVDVSNGGALRPIGPSSGAGFGLLRPTIERVQIDTAVVAGGTLKIYGSFGSDPGAGNRRVFVRDGTEIDLNVVAWTPDSIRVQPVTDEDAPGFYGDVVVVSRQHASNARRLHAWQGTAHYLIESTGSLQYTFDADFVGRFDADSTRAKPGDAAEANDHPQVFRVIPHPVVEARFAASGSATLDDCTMTWSGSGTISSSNPQPERSYVFDARLDPAAHELRVRTMQAIDTEGLISSCDGTFAGPVSFSVLYFVSDPLNPSLPILVDEQWRLQAGHWAFSSGEGGVSFDWPAVEPAPAYDPHQPR